MDLGRPLADSLRRLRQEAGITQVEMARLLAISQPTLNRLENGGQNTTLRTLARLCHALRCEPGDLFRPGQLRLQGRRRPKAG